MPVLWNAPPLLLGPAIAAPMVYAVLPAAQRHRGRRNADSPPPA